jgi:hypothetical protein
VKTIRRTFRALALLVLFVACVTLGAIDALTDSMERDE